MPKLTINREKFNPKKDGLMESDAEIQYADMPDEIMKKKKKGKIIIRKSKGNTKENIIDARANTRDTVKKSFDQGRLDYEKKIGEMIERMK